MRAALSSMVISLPVVFLLAFSGAAPASDPTMDEPATSDTGTALPAPRLCPAFITPPARMRDVWAAEADAREQPRRTVDTFYPAADEAGLVTQTPMAPFDAAPLPHTAPLQPTDDTASAPANVVAPQPAAEPPVLVEADRAELIRAGVSRLEGDVWLQQGERFVSTQAMEFDESTGIVRTLAPARFGNRQLILDAGSAVYDTSIGQGLFEDVDFYLPQRYARGEARVLARTSDTTAELESVKYTSCPPGDEDWWLKASSLTIDQEAGFGTGRNVRIAFMGVPFFYLPWLSFPIDERRKTGFLFPEFGDSGRNGAWLRTPYYLNLAPNYDATITPHYIQERGLLMEGQFRYLFGWGAGIADATHLGEDRVTGDTRHYYRLQHFSPLPLGWRMDVNYRQVSDEEYFQDFSESGSATLISHLAQSASVSKYRLEYGANLSFLRYQTVDPTIPESSRPYEIWPAVNYYYAPLPLWERLWFSTDGASVNFQRNDRVAGWRHHNESAFSTDIGNPGLRLTPKLAWWQTEYDMDQPDGTRLDISRGLPVSSLDIAARLMRPLDSGGLQTLEPRLYYLYVPFRDQSGIPLFDTRNASDTVATLFQENRFTGPDRVGDANRLTLGLGTGFIGADGREWFNATVARAWHLDDRRVALDPAAPPQTEPASDYYAGVEYLPSETQGLRLDLSWDPDEEHVGFGSAQYQFKPAGDTVFNVAYRFRRGSVENLEQADVSFAAPLGRRFQVFGRAVYSFTDERSQETMAGFEYESCCWIFRTFSRRFIFNREGEIDQSLWFQLELKGLSSVGRKIDEFLVNDIYGYGETP